MPRKKTKRNISRIEVGQDGGKVYGGWEVRLQRKGKKIAKFFSDLNFGGKRAALQAAKEFRDQLEQRYKKSTVRELSEKPSIRNRSGVVGVRLHEQKDQRGEYEYHYWYWVAQWTDGHGKRKTKSFSVHQYGDEEAYRLAVEAREKGVEQAKR